MSVTLGCVQPSYLAWIPFFQRMIASDIFVILDDVEYSKNSFHNRNRVKNLDNAIQLTVPVLYKHNSKKKISEIKIDNSKNWRKKHWQTILQSYQKSKFFFEFSSKLENIYLKDWNMLSDININLIKIFKEYLKIPTHLVISSEIKVKGQSNEKLVNLCKHFKADNFLVKADTESYHPKEFFLQNGIELKIFNSKPYIYKQLGDNFLPGLSILDYASNCGSNFSNLI